LALGRGLCAGPAVPCGLCRELPLGTGCAESIGACAERSLLSAKPQIPVVSPSLHRSLLGNVLTLPRALGCQSQYEYIKFEGSHQYHKQWRAGAAERRVKLATSQFTTKQLNVNIHSSGIVSHRSTLLTNTKERTHPF
jgi:hypothetical protein